MILEVAILDVKPGREAEFEAAFAGAQAIIVEMPGYFYEPLPVVEHYDEARLGGALDLGVR
jgi:heme-degrading monooxygenase HmoA